MLLRQRGPQFLRTQAMERIAPVDGDASPPVSADSKECVTEGGDSEIATGQEHLLIRSVTTFTPEGIPAPGSTKMEQYRVVMGWIGTGIDAAGVVVIAMGAIIATTAFLSRRHRPPGGSYTLYRQNLGRVILLGLEFLIAGDIIRTVVASPTLGNLYVLGMIVLIRTFLSMTLQLELDGRWPWQAGKTSPAVTNDPHVE